MVKQPECSPHVENSTFKSRFITTYYTNQQTKASTHFIK